MTKVRTRFAPSPTGFMHVGGIRTALFAYLVAKQAGGQFILRLEDTDKNREVEGSAEHIIKCLNALGLDYDEGPDKLGDFGPYKQSDRLDIYKKWANKLIEQGRAYTDPYMPDEVQNFREKAQKAKKPFLYRNHRPVNPPKWDGKAPLRFKSDPKTYEWHDKVMGDLHSGPEVIDDIILIKSDGYPTYNFAHIVDDAEMQITHVIRGQEFLASQPNYLNIYEALGLKIPTLATMPHILNEQGNKKLGKRDGAKDILDYLKDGFLPDTLVSFIATLGWNDGTEQEIFTRSELVEKFSLSRVQRSGARFDTKRLTWMNGQFIRQLSIDELYNKCIDFWSSEAKNADETYKKQILQVAQDRLKTLADLPELTSYFFTTPEPNMELISSNKQLKKLDKSELVNLLDIALIKLSQVEFTSDKLQITLNELLEETGQKPAVLFGLIRLALTWAPFSPGLPETLALLKKEVSLTRIDSTIKHVID